MSAIGFQASAQDQRREQILRAARQCFAESGFHGASMQMICAAAQMSPGALYRYFPSKEAIIEAIALDERERAAACVAGLTGPGHLFDRITAVGMTYLREMLDPESGGLMLEICAESARNTEIGRRFHEVEGVVRTAFHDALTKGQADGEVDPTLDLSVVLVVVFSLADGLLMRLQLEPNFSIETIEPHLRRMIEGLLSPRRDG